MRPRDIPQVCIKQLSEMGNLACIEIEGRVNKIAQTLLTVWIVAIMKTRRLYSPHPSPKDVIGSPTKKLRY